MTKGRYSLLFLDQLSLNTGNHCGLDKGHYREVVHNRQAVKIGGHVRQVIHI